MPMPAEFLTIDDVPIRVARGNATAGEPERSGENARAYDNTMRSSIDDTQRKRAWGIQTPPIPSAEWATVVAVLTEGVEHTAAGALIDRTGGSITVQIELGEVTFVADGDSDYQYAAALRMREV